jgi:hypothetical protein
LVDRSGLPGYQVGLDDGSGAEFGPTQNSDSGIPKIKCVRGEINEQNPGALWDNVISGVRVDTYALRELLLTFLVSNGC